MREIGRPKARIERSCAKQGAPKPVLSAHARNRAIAAVPGVPAGRRKNDIKKRYSPNDRMMILGSAQGRLCDSQKFCRRSMRGSVDDRYLALTEMPSY